MLARIVLLFLAACAVLLSQAVCDVKASGAAGDGATVDTAAINRAVAACHAVGGGTVRFPAGVYLTGTIHLKSNVTLRLDNGATILGSQRVEDYRWPEGERDWYAALILGQDVENVALVGPGTINGNRVFNPKCGTRGTPPSPTAACSPGTTVSPELIGKT